MRSTLSRCVHPLATVCVLAACSGSTIGPGITPYDGATAATDASPPDDVAASGTDATTDVPVPTADVPIADVPTADVPGTATDVPVTPEGPIDGTWLVTDILCGGDPAGAAARIYITPPNSSSFTVRGDRSTYTLVTSTCTTRLESSVTYPRAGRAVFTATGPFRCVPARCNARCDTMPAIPYVYDHERRGTSLVMTTVGPTPDESCTGFGQSNPITYTYAPR